MGVVPRTCGTRVRCALLCLLIVLLGDLCASHLAWSSPSDVRGSGNVAVKAYTNNKGNFILWSSGRITTLEGKEVNKESAYDSYASAKLPTRITGNILGASQVAVDNLSNSEGTWILFSDGTVKKPRNSDASAPTSSSRRVVTGVSAGNGSSKSGNDGWSSRFTSLSFPDWSGYCKNVMEIVFKKSFKKTPVFLFVVENYAVQGVKAELLRLPTGNPFDCKVSTSRAYVIGPFGRDAVTSTLKWRVTFVAFEPD